MAKKTTETIPEKDMKSTIVGGFKFWWTTDENGINTLRKIRIPYSEKGGEIDINLPRFIEEVEEES